MGCRSRSMGVVSVVQNHSNNKKEGDVQDRLSE